MAADKLSRIVAANLAIFFAYWLVSHLSWLLARHYGILPMVIWPAASIALAAGLAWRWRALPGLYLAAVAANWWSLGVSLTVALGIGVMNAIAPVASAVFLRRLCAEQPSPFASVRYVFAFVVVGVMLHAVMTATGGVAALWLGGALKGDGGTPWLRWWLAHASGTMLFAPALVLWSREPAWRLRRGEWSELAAAVVLGLAATALAYFGTGANFAVGVPLLLVAPVVWIAVRFTAREVATYVPLAVMIVIAATLLDRGALVAAGDLWPLMNLGLVILSYSLIGLVLAALVEEKGQTETQLLVANRASLETNRFLEDLVQEGQQLEQTKGRLVEIIEAARDLILSSDAHGRIIYFNQAGREMLGIPADEDLSRTTLADYHPPATAEQILTEALPQAAQKGFWEGETEFLSRGGERIPTWQIIVVHRNATGSSIQYSTVARDIRQRRQAEEELRLAANVFHSSAEGITVTDADGIILAVNPAFTEITGYTADEVVGRRPNILKSDHHDEAFYEAMWADLKGKGRWQGEIWNRGKNGEALLVAQTINMVPDAEGKPARYVGVFTDITENRRQQEHIHHLAFHDALTNLPNRALVMDRLHQTIAKAAREERIFALLFLDLDHFKAVNDTLGHDVGDNLLRQVASRLGECVRTTDTVARLGGDEFVVLLDEMAVADDAVPVAEKIIASLNVPMQLSGHVLHVTTSVGIGLYPQDGKDVQTLLKSADTALYSAKEAGRNAFRFFSSALNEQTGRRLRLEDDLRQAVGQRQFELHYQPKICLRADSPCGVEALIRWRHPEHGLMLPGEFLGLAEGAGLMAEIGEWVIDEACRQAVAWQARGWGRFSIAINVSAQQLHKTPIAASLAAAAGRHGIEPSLFQVEVTESAVMEDPERVAESLLALRRLGVPVAVDDFGAGYSSLVHLRRLPIDILKVAPGFVGEAVHNEEDAAIVRTIIALARSLKMTVVAKGVETEPQAALLKELGCHLAQGYHYAKPMSAEDFDRWLAARPSAGCSFLQLKEPG